MSPPSTQRPSAVRLEAVTKTFREFVLDHVHVWNDAREPTRRAA